MLLNSCPSCGSPLQPASSMGGLCPACLLKQALAADDESGTEVELEQSEESEVPRLAPGVTFGRFQIVGVLGRGGMATVYEAVEAPPLNRPVALKVLPPALLDYAPL